MEQPTTSPRSWLEFVHPADLQEHWGKVLPGLLKVQRHSAGHWIPEDVYSALKTGNSTLHLAFAPDYVGFVILTPSLSFDAKYLHVWCAYTSKRDVWELFAPELEKMARNIGAKRLTFWSPRAWDRLIGKHGYKRTQVEYVKELI